VPDADPRPAETSPLFETAVTRLTLVILELAISWLGGYPNMAARRVEIEAALIRAAAVFARVISRQYGVDCQTFANLARFEFDIAIEAMKAKSEQPSPRLDNNDTGTRH
jgi:hypothetical protein